jgi:hypothetical protein
MNERMPVKSPENAGFKPRNRDLGTAAGRASTSQRDLLDNSEIR